MRALLSYIGNHRLSSHSIGYCANTESKSNHVEHSSWEPTPENRCWGIKIKLILIQGEEEKNNNRLCHFYLTIHNVVGAVQNNEQDRIPAP